MVKEAKVVGADGRKRGPEGGGGWEHARVVHSLYVNIHGEKLLAPWLT